MARVQELGSGGVEEPGSQRAIGAEVEECEELKALGS